MRRAWIVLAAVALVGAGCQAPTELLVAFDFEPSLYPHATSVEASVFRYDGDDLVFVQRNTLLIDDTTSWPRYFLRAVQSTPSSEEILVVAEATLEDGDGTWTLDQTARVAYAPGESRQVILRFDRSCPASCPEPLRCWEGACVERCLAGELVDSTTEPSEPVACGEPCDAPGHECVDGLLLECVDGVRRLREECQLGCSAPDQCDVVRASNLGVPIAPATFGELRAPSGMWVALRDVTGADPHLRVTNKSDGAIEDVDPRSAGPLEAFGRTIVTPRGDPPRGIDVRLEAVTIDGEEHEYFVVEVGDLIVEEDAELALGYFRPVILLVHGVAIVEGTVRGDDGRAGARADSAGRGEHDASASGGGGGGGFGTPGGDGGDGGGAGGGPGGEVIGDPRLVPLTTGAAGGAGGGPSGDVAAGAGGVQITAATGICVGPTGQLRLRGQNGADATAMAGAGGGGSGGGVLLEAPTIYVLPRPSISPAVDVQGGDGGRGARADGALDSNTAGSGDLTGDGGEDAGRRSGTRRGAGGGGGAGRVRVNTIAADVITDRACPFVESPPPTGGIEGLISSPPTASTLTFGSLSACHPDSCTMAP